MITTTRENWQDCRLAMDRMACGITRAYGAYLLAAIALLFGWGAPAVNAASYTYTTTTFAWHDPIAAGDTRISTDPALVAQVPAPPPPYWPNPASCSGYCDNLGDDAISALINIGFTFNFAGTNYTQLQVQTDGRLQFNNNYSYYGTSNIGSYGPNPSPPPPFIWSGANPRQYTLPLPDPSLNNTMQVYGTDVDVSPNGSGAGPSPTGCSAASSIPTAGNNYVQGKCGVYFAQLPAGCTANVNCTQFVVTWLNVPDWGDATSSYNFQAILNQNGTFIYQYNTSVNPEFGQANVGYQGASVADNVNYVYPGPTSPYSGGIASLAGTAVLWGTVPTTTVGKFNAFETGTAAAQVTGFINTKVAGAGFTLALVANNAGVQDNTFNGAVTVDLIGNTTIGTPLSAPSNCPTSFTQVLAPFAANIVNGRSNVAFAAVPNVWQDVRVRIVYAGLPATTVCSTDNFAIRPSSLTVSASDNTWNTAGGGRGLANAGSAGGNVHQAGAPFTVAVSVLPATATQYNGSPTVVSANCAVLAGMGGCNPGVLALPGGASWTAGNPLVNNTASYSEAGAFTLTVEDHNFASVDAADGESAAVLTVPQAGGAITLGRFVPANFIVTATAAAPVFKTFNTTDALCNAGAPAPKRTFTYIGQQFGYVTAPTVTVTAVNLAGTTTTNYRSTGPGVGLWHLAASPPAASVSCPSANVCNVTVGSVIESYTENGGKAWDNAQFAISPTTITAGTGTGTITLSAADLIAYLRSVNTPVVTFNANISLNLTVQDTSENAPNQGNILTTGGGATFNGAGAGIVFDGGGAAAGAELRYGRLRLANANGSELLPLNMRMTTQYFAAGGAGFVDNTADNCTTIANNNIGFANFKLNLTAGATAAAMPAGAFLSGVKNLTLTAPGANKYGSADVVVDLGTPIATCTALVPLPAPTSANLAYLRDLQSCSAGNYNQDPTARATFGGYGVNRNFIYLRENY